MEYNSGSNAPIKSKLQHRPPGKPRACVRGMGNLTITPSRGRKFDLCLGGVGKIEPVAYGFKYLFLVPKSPKAMNSCLNERKSLKEEIAIS